MSLRIIQAACHLWRKIVRASPRAKDTAYLEDEAMYDVAGAIIREESKERLGSRLCSHKRRYDQLCPECANQMFSSIKSKREK